MIPRLCAWATAWQTRAKMRTTSACRAPGGRAILEEGRECFSFDQLHREIRPPVREPALRVDRHDRRVCELTGDTGLGEEPPDRARLVTHARLHYLDGQGALKLEVADPPHDVHSARVDPTQHRVPGEIRFHVRSSIP
jgi:hypothetical protein